MQGKVIFLIYEKCFYNRSFIRHWKSFSLRIFKKKYIVGLSGRRIELLKKISNKCKSLGGTTFVYKLDVNNQSECENISKHFQKKANGINIVIANAGIGGDDGLFNKNSKKINTILNTNILGVTNSTMPFIPIMKEQRYGTLVCISSVASFLPTPFHGGYSSSKIAIRMIFDSWRPTLNNYNIKVITICPGFIDTPIIKGPAKKFPMVPVNKAASKFIKIINKGNRTYIYPWPYNILIIIKYFIPNILYNWVINKIFFKK